MCVIDMFGRTVFQTGDDRLSFECCCAVESDKDKESAIRYDNMEILDD